MTRSKRKPTGRMQTARVKITRSQRGGPWAREGGFSAGLLLAALSALTVGCAPGARAGRVGNAGLRAAPERVELSGREYTLSASLWRDFEPIAPPDGQPLALVFKVAPTDSAPGPDEPAVERVWVLGETEQWSPRVEKPLSGQLEHHARGGPKWAPGTVVDVVVRLKQGAETRLLRQAGVRIRRTD